MSTRIEPAWRGIGGDRPEDGPPGSGPAAAGSVHAPVEAALGNGDCAWDQVAFRNFVRAYGEDCHRRNRTVAATEAMLARP
jgi:hypothetical protein